MGLLAGCISSYQRRLYVFDAISKYNDVIRKHIAGTAWVYADISVNIHSTIDAQISTDVEDDGVSRDDS